MLKLSIRTVLFAAVVGRMLVAQGEEPPPPVRNQFGPPVQAPAAGFLFDNVYGELINFETMMVKPILVTGDGQFVVVANEADNRLVVMNQSLAWPPVAEVALGQGICAVVERPGSDEIWVTLRHQCGIAVVDKTTWTVTHWLRPPILPTAVGMGAADTMSGLAFDGAGAKAYAAASSAEKLLIFNAASKQHLSTVDLKFSHNGQMTAMNEPFAVTVIENVGGNADKDLVFVASYRSGNQTLADRPASTNHPLVTNQVTNLAGQTQRTLPDFDLMAYDIASGQIAFVVNGCGTVLNGITAVSSTSLVVSNTESRNGERVGESSFLGGSVVRNRLTKVNLAADGSGPTTVRPEIVENLTNLSSPPWVNIVLPTDMAYDATADRLYVAGYGSKSIGVFDGGLGYIASIPGDSGPLGVALSPNGQKLFAYNRAAATVTSYDLTSGIPNAATATRSLPDPTYDRVKSGRALFLDSTHSLRGTTSCASCHAHLRNDGLTWDLSKHYDPGTNFSTSSLPTNWKDPKGAMQTQDLRSLEEIPSYHWRGEQADIEDFAGVFEGLLKGTPHTNADFKKIKNYIFSGRYPSNPSQMLNRDFSSVAHFGLKAFIDPLSVEALVPDSTGSCVSCHAFPLGSDGAITESQQHGSGDLSIKTAQLRGLWDKISDEALAQSGETVASIGTGFMHHGLVRSLRKFLDEFQTFKPKDEVTQFLMEYDSGVAPSATYSEFLTAGQSSGGAFLVDQAERGHCDLAVRGWQLVQNVWKPIGFFYRTDLDGFIASDGTVANASNAWTLSQLQASAAAGTGRFILIGCPLGSGIRIGVDRDRDMLFDDDETTAGTDPAQPDTDGDGYWDGYESDPTNGAIATLPSTGPTISNVVVQWITNVSAKITYDTSVPSPTWVKWNRSQPSSPLPLNQKAGDENVPFGTGVANTTNRWKTRHQVFLRKLNPASSYEFEVFAHGQNGVVTSTGQRVHVVTTAPPVPFHNTVTTSDIQLAQVTSGGQTTWTATVTVVNADGSPAQNVGINPVLTTSTGGVLAQVGFLATPTSGTTDSQGIATIVFVVTAQSSGDWAEFDIPVAEWTSTNQTPGATPLNLSKEFVWPKSTARSVRVVIP